MRQTEMVLGYISQHGSITQAEAIDAFGCYRLGARIYDLKMMGLDVRKTMEKGTNRFGTPVQYARYWIKAG